MSSLLASSGLAGQPPADGPTLAFEYKFEKQEELDDWVVEGPGQAEIEDGRLILTPTFQPKLMELVTAGKLSGENDQKEYGPALEELYRNRDGNTIPGQYTKGIFRGGPFNIWCKKQMPENYIIEWQFEALSPHALHMIMFGAKGLKGEDVLAPSLPKRTGLASEIMHGGIHTYRVSFFHPERRTANMRKAPGRVMTASGPDLSVERPNVPHKMRVIAWKGTFTYWIDGEKMFTFTDPDPVPGGQMGFRLMALAKGAYSDLRVYEITRAPEGHQPTETTSTSAED